MKTFLIAVVVLFAATTTISALGTENRPLAGSDDGYTGNFQDTTKKKDKKKKDTTEKKDTAFAQYHH